MFIESSDSSKCQFDKKIVDLLYTNAYKHSHITYVPEKETPNSSWSG